MFEYITARFNDPAYSDFTLVDELNRTLHLHRFILARSPYFDTYFKTKAGSHDPCTMEVSAEEFNDLLPLLQYLYTGKLYIIPEQILQILETANQYLMIDLITVPESLFYDLWTTEPPNWAEVLRIYSLYKPFPPILTWLLAKYYDTIPKDFCCDIFLKHASDYTLILLALRFGRLEWLDKYHPRLDDFKRALSTLSENGRLKLFTPKQLTIIDTSSRQYWIHCPEHWQDAACIYIDTMSPFVAYRRVLTLERPRGNYVLWSAANICNTVYVLGLGLRQINITQDGPCLRLQWDFQVPPDGAIHFLSRLN